MMTINLNENFTIRILPEAESQHMRKLPTEKRIDREAYIGVCEDAKVGINIIFHVQNADDYIKNIDKVDYLEKVPSITLSGLCNEGTILLFL